ncbi:MAG: putative oxidoreductase C-terminal domain-containing protein [Gemmataceae bacterium]
MSDVRLITLDPAHFHAALVQKAMYSQVDPTVHVYAPLTTDLTLHINRIVGFNTRAEKPTSWNLEVHATPDFLTRFGQEKPGNVVVLSGRNRVKIDYILQAVELGINVLADKPWILVAEDLPKLQKALDTAEEKGLIIYDIMTERYEITSMLQQEFVNSPEVFGEIVPGSPDKPGVYMESVHYLMKEVAGAPLRRPDWYFDIHRQGEGLADVGTHLVDLVMWLLFPKQPIDHYNEVEILSAKRWPTIMTQAEFERVTGEPDFPSFVSEHIKDAKFEYFCNTAVTYTVRGIHTKLDVLWDYEATEGGDKHLAIVRGTKSNIEIRQGKEEKFIPELYVVAQDGMDKEVDAALPAKVESLQGRFPGVAASKEEKRWKIIIPEQYRVGHEAHFAEVTNKFLEYLGDPKSIPAWEKPNMMAKYYVTTQGVEVSRK